MVDKFVTLLFMNKRACVIYFSYLADAHVTKFLLVLRGDMQEGQHRHTDADATDLSDLKVS